MTNIEKYDAALDYLNNIEDLKNFKFTDLLIEILRENNIHDAIVEPCTQSIGYLLMQGAYDQAAIQLVRSHYPNARYGFDYNPIIQPDKKGKEKKAAAWVRCGAVDITSVHKFPSVALIAALISVMRAVEIRRQADQSSQ